MLKCTQKYTSRRQEWDAETYTEVHIRFVRLHIITETFESKRIIGMHFLSVPAIILCGNREKKTHYSYTCMRERVRRPTSTMVDRRWWPTLASR